MSYRITIDGDPFCASNFEDSQILNSKVTLEVNKSGSLVFTMLPGHPYYDKIEFRQSLFDVYLNDELIFEGIPVSESTDFFNRKTVTCEGELTFLNDTIQRQAVYQDQTVQTLLGSYLSVHNAQADADKQFSIGAVTVDGGNGIYRYTNFESTMKEIQDDLVENFGGYFRVRHANGVRYLDYLESSPHSSSQTIRIGKNLVDFSRNLSSLDICTVLIPLGAKTGESVIDGLDQRLTIESVNSGKDYLVGSAQAYYGNVWKMHTWDDVTTAEALKTKGQAYLDDVQWANLVISATAIDLGLAVDDVERFHVLDMIRVVSEPHGLDRYFLLSKLELDLDHPANTRITLGQDQRLSLSARTTQISGEVQKQQTTLMVNASENARQILDSATDGAIQILYNENGVAYELRINNSQNPDTATKWWRYNSGGWGYTADGGQTYTIAATMDGALLANIISSGILQSREGNNPKFYLNLDTGELRGNFSSLSIQSDSVATQDYTNAAAASAQSAAETTAAADATAKANAAQSAAEATAAADATSKANAAQSAAEATAAADATAKANAAEAAAVSTAASNTSAAISNYDSGLDQMAVFNKLTNNQANQGIYIQDGQVYVNASMILAGILAGIEINNGNGTFRVDENGNVTANSLSSSNATITGGSIDVSRNETRGSTAFNILSRFLRIINTYDNGETDINAGSARFYTPNNNNNELIILANSISASTGVGLLSWMINSGGISFMSGNTLVSYPASGISSISGNATKGSIRFKQGKVQIAWNTVTWTGKLNHAWGSGIYESASVISLGNWQQSFNAAPSVAYSANSNGNLTAWVAAGTSSPSASSAGSIVLERVNSSDASQTWTVRAIAVGTYT